MGSAVGTDTKISTQNMLSKLMMDDTAVKFSLKGARGKLSFSNYSNLKKMIFGKPNAHFPYNFIF